MTRRRLKKIMQPKEAMYQRMVALVSRKEDATKEKSIINKEEEESTCLTGSEIKKSYTSTFTKRWRKESNGLSSIQIYFSIERK